MIIEMILPLDKELTLLAAWEFNEILWQSKETSIRKFIKEILNSQTVLFKEEKQQGNLVFRIDTKPYRFYDVQSCFNDYFKSLGAKIIVN